MIKINNKPINNKLKINKIDKNKIFLPLLYKHL